ncbi:MAG: sigma-70 family RNA polymerase sigma factor [Gemmatales bacterium]
MLKQCNRQYLLPQGEGDQALLQRYFLQRDQSAFAEVVQRHCRLVWSVCRQMLPGESDAEDAFQATFLALIRTGSMVKGPLAPWLHRVAFRIALKQRRATARRLRREQMAARAEATLPVSDSAWNTLLSAVHEEVARLPESLRVPFVLCCLEGWSTSSAAEHVGWKLGTFSGRLTHAKQRLLRKLASRGLPLTAIGLTVATLEAATAISPLLLTQTAQLGLPHVRVATHLLALTQGVVTMKSTLIKSAAVLVLLFGTVGTTSWLAASPQGNAQTGTSNADTVPNSNVTYANDKGKEAIAGTVVPPSSGSKTLYLFYKLDKPISQEEYVKLFDKYEGNGWEYIGSVPSLNVEKDSASVQTTLVFRQPIPGGITHSAERSKGSHPALGKVPQPSDSLTRSSLQSNPPVLPHLTTTANELEEMRSLQGSWKRTRSLLNGAAYPGGGLASLNFNLNNSIDIDSASLDMTYYINAGKTPKELTLVGKGTLFQCIYQVSGDKLTIAFYGRSEHDRPRSFSVKEKVADLPLIVNEYERQKR